MDGNNPFLNGGFALGGGLGSMPVAAPYSLGGVGLGALLQGGSSGVPGVFGAALPPSLRSNMLNSVFGNGTQGQTEYAPFGGDKAEPEQISNASQTEYAPFGGDTAPQTEYAPFGGDTAPASPQQQTPDATSGNNAEAFRMMARGIQNMAPRVQFPSGNTAQIIRDNNQFRFAGTPQQQMANALRRR